MSSTRKVIMPVNHGPNFMQVDTTHGPNFMQVITAGCISGAVGSVSSFVCEGTKKRLQSGQVIPKLWVKIPSENAGYRIKWQNPLAFFRETFRGLNSFTCSLVPTCVIQQSMSHYLHEKKLTNDPTGKVVEAAVSGAVGGIASTLAERNILYQQMHQCGPMTALRQLSQAGIPSLFRGLPMLLNREGIFGLCVLNLNDRAAEYAIKEYGVLFKLPAQLLIGAAGSIISQPFDTVATVMQQHELGAGTAAKKVYQKGGIRAFYRGGLARIGLFSIAMITISETNKLVLAGFDKSSAKAPSKRHE